MLASATAGRTPRQDLLSPTVKKPISCTVYDRQQAENGGDPDSDPRLVLIRAGDNLGFAGGNNVGLKYALARSDLDYVWLLNNDTIVDLLSLQALVS